MDIKEQIKEYVIGFLFNDNSNVLLIRKNRPEWQKGKLNGVGGHIESGEKPIEAMRREFTEEAGANIEWTYFATMQFNDCNVHCFMSTIVCCIETMTDEILEWHPINNLPDDVIPNLRWLIPMALSRETYMRNVVTCPDYSQWLKDNNYYPLQAGSEGLVTVVDYFEDLTESISGKLAEQLYPRMIKMLKAQKALCDKEKEEAVKKVGDKIRKFDKGEGWIELGEADLADIIKQTLEPINKLTCRGCNKELDNCTCDVLTIKKEPTYILKPVKNNPYIKMAQESEKEWLGGWSTKRNNYSREKNGYARGVDNQLETDQLIVDKLQAERDAAIYKVGRLSRELGEQDFRIEKLEAIDEAHRIENGELRERIKELEELMPTKEESMWLLDRIGIAKYFIVNHSVIAKLQKIIGDK